MPGSRSYTRIWGYMAREFMLSFAVMFLFFFFIFFVNQVLVMAEDILSRRVALWDVVRLIVYALPWVVALSFPFASLVGALMAVGRLSSDNESLALGALGVPQRQLLVPLLVLGLAFSAVSFVMNDYFLPLGNIRYAELYRRIIYANPAVELEPHSIKKIEDTTTIVTGDVEGNTIHDLVIFDRTADRARRVIVARTARLEEQTRGVVSLVLTGVFSEVAVPKEGDRYDYTTAETMVYNVSLRNITVSLGALSPAQQSSLDVWRQIVDKERAERERIAQREERAAGLAYDLAVTLRAAREASARAAPTAVAQGQAVAEADRQYVAEATRDVADHNLRSYLLEFHWKFAVPAACVVFAFFAWPVGLLARRSGRAVGFGVGLFVAIAYWGLLFAGRTFGVRLASPPALAMWLPNALVAVAGILVISLRRRHG